MTAPAAYIKYWRLTRVAMYIWLAAILLSSIFSPLPNAFLSVRILVLLLAGLAVILWIAANARYVPAWDELQRRALAEFWAVALPLIRKHYEA